MVDKEKMVRNRMNERVRQEVISATVYSDAYMLNVHLLGCHPLKTKAPQHSGALHFLRGRLARLPGFGAVSQRGTGEVYQADPASVHRAGSKGSSCTGPV